MTANTGVVGPHSHMIVVQYSVIGSFYFGQHVLHHRYILWLCPCWILEPMHLNFQVSCICNTSPNLHSDTKLLIVLHCPVNWLCLCWAPSRFVHSLHTCSDLHPCIHSPSLDFSKYVECFFTPLPHPADFFTGPDRGRKLAFEVAPHRPRPTPGSLHVQRVCHPQDASPWPTPNR